METPAPMHSDAAGEALRFCRYCGSTFSGKRSWAAFCGPKCRNSWHAMMRPEAVREARELVRQVLTGEADPQTWNPRARKLLGLK